MPLKKPLKQILHTHKYKKVRQYPGVPTKVFRCMLPNCNHFIQLTFIEGKVSICWGCGDPFVIGKKAMHRTKPKCNTCVKKSPYRERKIGTVAMRDEQREITQFSKLADNLANALDRGNDD